LVPLFFITAAGVSMGVFSILRWFIYSPDVKVKRSDKDPSWDYIETPEGYKHSKLIKLHDYSKLKPDPYRPKLD